MAATGNSSLGEPLRIAIELGTSHRGGTHNVRFAGKSRGTRRYRRVLFGLAQTKGEPVTTQSMSMPIKNKAVLAVDDLTDAGKTLACVKEDMETERS
jgi:phosphoribosylpyrophosphate synthetase